MRTEPELSIDPPELLFEAYGWVGPEYWKTDDVLPDGRFVLIALDDEDERVRAIAERTSLSSSSPRS